MHKIQRFFIGGRHFKEEFRKQLRLLIIVTLGFTIAFSWRQTIFDLMQTFIQKFITGNTASAVFTSTFITLLSLLVIYATSQLLKEQKDDY